MKLKRIARKFQNDNLIRKSKKRSKERYDLKKSISFFKSIKFRFMVGVLLPVLGIIILGIVSYDRASDAVVNGYQSSAVQTVNSIENYLDLVTETVQSRYKTYIADADIIKYFNGQLKLQATDSTLGEHEIVKSNYEEDFHKKVNSDTLIEDIMFLSDEEQPISTNRLLNDDVKPYYEFMNTANGKTVAKDPYKYHWFGNTNPVDKKIGADNETYAFRLVRKVDDNDAVMLVDIEKSIIVDSLKDLDVGDGGYVGIIMSDGSEILSEDNSKTKEKVFYNQDFYKKVIKETDKKDSVQKGVKTVKYKGENYRFLYTRLKNKEFMVCALISEEYLLSKVKAIQFTTIVVVVIASLIAGVVGFIIIKGIIDAIYKTIEGLNKVSLGDFTSKIIINREDELKLISDAVNDTVENVKELIASVQEVNSEVVQASDRVYDSSVFFVNTSQNIKNSVEEINAGAYKLDDDSNNCLKQMDMLSDKIETVTVNTEEIGKVAEETNRSIVTGISTMEVVTDTTNQTTRITGEVIDAIEALQANSRSIRNIVNVINDIAEQTNLISLNAAIEAARVGEAGKGFSVIAGEIIKLSNESQDSAGQISSIIDEILVKTNKVVRIAGEAFEMVKRQNLSVDTTKDAFEDMRQNIDTLLIGLNGITKNVLNMGSAREITLKSIENISVVSAQTAQSSTVVTDTVDSQTNAINDLNSAASMLAAKSAQLTELLEKFKV